MMMSCLSDKSTSTKDRCGAARLHSDTSFFLYLWRNRSRVGKEVLIPGARELQGMGVPLEPLHELLYIAGIKISWPFQADPFWQLNAFRGIQQGVPPAEWPGTAKSLGKGPATAAWKNTLACPRME